MKPGHKTSILLAVSILTALLAFSGNSRAKDDWLPVPPEDLALKDNPLNPGAHAMILYRETAIETKIAAQYEYRRIKIFTEEGKKFGDVELPFLKSQSDIKDVRARTIRPDGSIVNFDGAVYEKEIVKSGGIKYLAKTFSLPEVQPGCIIEYKYREQFDSDYYWSVEWQIQGDLFTRTAKFSIVPNNVPGAPGLYFRLYRTPQDSKPEKQKDGSLAMEIHNLPGVDQEDLMPPENYIRARVAFYYRSQDDPQNETAEQFWKRIGKSWNEKMEKFIDKKSALQGVVSQTVAPSDAPEVKLQKLYAHVLQIHNTSFDVSQTREEDKREKMKPNNNVDDLLKRGSGNATEVNELMVGLARAAGFESSMAYVAPRSNNGFYPAMQDTTQLGANIVWIKVGNQDLYLDPAAKFYGYGVLPWYETGVAGLRLDKQGGTNISVPMTVAADATRERHAEVRLEPDGTLSGKLEITYFRQWGGAVRNDERNEDDTGKKKDITDEVKGWITTGSTFEITSMTGWDKIEEPLHIEGTLKIPGFAIGAGHRVLLPLTFFRDSYPASFQPEKRSNALYFRYPALEKDSFSFHLPGEFKIETLPSPEKIAPGANFEYSLASAQDGDVVKIDRRLAIGGGSMFPSNTYPTFRKFFNTVKTDDDGQIVLQPAQAAKGN